MNQNPSEKEQLDRLLNAGRWKINVVKLLIGIVGVIVVVYELMVALIYNYKVQVLYDALQPTYIFGNIDLIQPMAYMGLVYIGVAIVLLLRSAITRD